MILAIFDGMYTFQVVVMACREIEMGKHKCERYWPQVKQSMEIGAITVTTVSLRGGGGLGLWPAWERRVDTD